MEQRSPEWFAARLGKVTASRVADVIAETRSGPAAARANYMAELVAERLAGEAAERFVNATMQWGTDKEPDARDAYSFRFNVDVDEVGLIDHPSISMTGASPDGLIGEEGMLEIKCPNTATHIATLRGGKIKSEYMTQMQWQMACAGRQWCDFVSYDPRLPEAMRLHVRRVPRDDDMIADLEAKVSAFLDEVAETVADLQAAYATRLAA